MSASYGIDNAQLVVWLDSSPSPDPMLAGSLCRRHADALIVPKGWRIDDRREEIPRLFPAHALAGPDESRSSSGTGEHTSPASVRKRVSRTDEVTPSLFDDNVSRVIEQETAEIVPSSHAEAVVAELVDDVVGDDNRDNTAEHSTDDVAEDDSASDALEETRAIPWMPRIVSRGHDGDDDADNSDVPTDATPAQGRLLRRAFGDRNVR